MSYKFLLDLALILMSTKLFGIITRKFKIPQVVGALLAGLILGPAGLGVLQETEFFTMLSEIGVVVLMFNAGLETDLTEMKKCGVASTIIAVLGVGLPLVCGTILGELFSVGGESLLENIFIGVVLTATSVSITVETLKEMGKLNTKVSNTILGAALIDDVLGIIVLTVISSLSTGETSGSASIAIVLLKIVAFFVLSGVVGVVFHKLFASWFARSLRELRRFVVMAFVFCLLFSYMAEEFFGVADITGAFIAGLILSGTKRSNYLTARFETISYMFLSPIFFASVGLAATLTGMSSSIVWFTVVLTIVAILAKIIGCGLGAKISKFGNKESLQIGIGMVSRGEVALIIANKGLALGLISSLLFTPIIIMVIATTILAPIFLKLAFSEHDEAGGHEEKQFSHRADKSQDIDPYNGADIIKKEVHLFRKKRA